MSGLPPDASGGRGGHLCDLCFSGPRYLNPYLSEKHTRFILTEVWELENSPSVKSRKGASRSLRTPCVV